MGDFWYQTIFLFFIYGFLGWCCEVVFATLESGKFVNRGFLNGPICPIYGVGVVAVLRLLMPIKGSVVLLFFASMFITTLLELITGYVMEKLFDDQWWDYSDRPFNLGGYICLEFSIMWGLACLLVVYVFHPLVLRGIHALPRQVGLGFMILCGICFVADIIMTLTTIFKLKKRLRRVEELTHALRKISDKLGEELSDGTLVVLDKGGEIREGLGEKYQDMLDKGEEIREGLGEKYQEIREGLGEKYQEMRDKSDEVREDMLEKGGEMRDAVVQRLQEQSAWREAARQREQLQKTLREEARKQAFGENRLVKAFPHLKKGRYGQALGELTRRRDGHGK